MAGLSGGPVTLGLLIARLDEGLLDHPTAPDRFSPREVVAHLADWEPIFRSRIARAISEENPTVAVFDEGDRAADFDYQTWDIARSLESFTRERAATEVLLAGLEPAQWNRTFNHPELGAMTVAQQAGMLVGHDAYHIRQLIEVMCEHKK